MFSSVFRLVRFAHSPLALFIDEFNQYEFILGELTRDARNSTEL